MKTSNFVKTIVSVALFLSFVANADEGWWTDLRVSGGSFYSKIEHPDIELAKEVLIYHGQFEGPLFGDSPGCEARFLFRNIAEQSHSLKVGFPVKVVIPPKRKIETGYAVIDPADSALIKYRNKKGIQRWRTSWKDFAQISTFWNGIELIRNFTITQDGKSVDIDSVLIESKTSTGDTSIIHFHFLHKLNFRPSSYSTVKVQYSSFSTAMDTGSPQTATYIDWRYILETGSTWKGPIKTIYFLLPEHLKPELPAPFTCIGSFRGKKIFLASNYEPLKGDDVHVKYINYSHGDFFYIQTIDEPAGSAQSFINLKGASSSLPQTTWINSYFTGTVSRSDTMWKNIFLPGYYISFYEPPESLTPAYIIEDLPVTCKNIGFGARSLFDGLHESAWCEGAEGDGIGEWVEFELKEDVVGAGIYNGFSKSPESFLWHDEDTVKVARIKATYGNNNRVKILQFISADSTAMHEIELRDTPEEQVFRDLNLVKGTYRLYIKDIYKGAKWDDTCLGEIVFYSASARDVVEADQFLRDVLRGIHMR